MSRCNFRYFTRYCRVLIDDARGDEGPFELWSAQERLVQKVGEVEKKMWDLLQAGRKEYLDGNNWFIHKARQRGASTVCQTMGVHRTVLWSKMNGLMAGVDETSTLKKLYEKYYYAILQSLPRWMQIDRTGDSNEGISFANGSSVLLQNSTGANVGQGAKWHWVHLTECAAWDKSRVSDQIDNHLTNAISPSIKGMAFLESTSQGMNDWWHQSTELARRHLLPRWNYFFVPWYAIKEISVNYPPEKWRPNEDTVRHAEFVKRTSPEFMDGQTYELTLPQMYFWEQKRQSFEEKGNLAAFYINFPATPEESFVSTGRSSFPVEVLTWHDANTREPWAYYDILSSTTPSERVITEPARRTDGSIVHPPPIKRFGNIEIGPVRVTDHERRLPLGLIRIFEPPDDVRLHDTYCSADTADGLAGWNRFIYKPEDDKADRAAIQMIRRSLTPHGPVEVQIGEFYAPISAVQQAPYVVAMGMLMHGRNALEQQPPVMTELTGTGKILNEELQNRYGWFHFYQDFKYDGQEWTETTKSGWTPNGTTVRQLWARGKDALVDIRPMCPTPKCASFDVAKKDGVMKCAKCGASGFSALKIGRVIVRSKPLVDEMRICQDDVSVFNILARFTRGKAKEGTKLHDDLVYSLMFDIWQANLFNVTPAGTTTQPVHMTVGAGPNAQIKRRDLLPEERAAFDAEVDARLLGYS